jgi:Cys-rich repeat protein
MFMLVGLLMPLSIALAGAVALRERRKDDRPSEASRPACAADSECPPGFVCFNGRCVPAS